MLEIIIEKTKQYIDKMPKTEQKKYGQFFTSMETAQFMVGLYNIPQDMNKVSVLDAGAGSGILSCALIERLETIESIQEVELTCYENDSNVLPLLQENLLYYKEYSEKILQLIF
jgi:adenine-specific DNA-methyltransferase